ncbi:hypothetical protein VTN77DRAFT_8702 [Rasamsonia byssochlamydoides]|uniref:uncharacterized protein n=1 Tax=Rasamsonia byssochlamydoides TaxID=89139 RepID=UPI0037432207
MASNSDSKPPPPDRPGSFPSRTPAKPRVLAPELAKIRSQTHSPFPSSSHATAPTPFSSSSSSANTTKTTPPPTSTTTSSSASSSSFLNRFRARYSALPAPVRRTFRVLRILAPVVPIGIFFSEHVLQVMWVRGPSMTPYLNEDYAEMQTRSDMVLVNMWPWGWGWPWQRRRRLERGMVVTFRSPANPSHIAIKRVIALPGDRVITREPCPKPSQIVPFNHVWLEGDVDDPRKSLDSNTYGPVSISLITGRVIAVLWPRMRLLKWWEWDRDDEEGGPDYRRSVRERVVKEAVKLERPVLE